MSMDEANRRLVAAEDLAEQRAELIESIKGRLEDANHKLHKINNEANATVLAHEAEKLELLAKIDAMTVELKQATARLADLERKNAELVERMSGGLTETTRVAAENSARLDTLEGEASR
jgi:DNA repair exonuclease SbcCD ATPase subunit